MSKSTKKITFLAMLIAVSIVLVYLVRFPIFPSAAFLEYDPADIPILIGGMIYGPVAGIIITLVASAVQAFTVSAANGVYGLIMHVIATGTLVTVASLIYSRKRSEKSAIIGLILGTISMAAVMMVANHYITSYYFHLDRSIIDSMLIPVILPFNLIKAGVNSIAAYFVRKPLKKLIDREK